MAALHTQVKTLKAEITKLKKQHAAEITKAAKIHLESEAEIKEELSVVKRQLGESQAQTRNLKSGLEKSEQMVENFQGMCRDIQRDMKVVCEAVYGHEFDPTWTGDPSPDELRVQVVTHQPPEYLEPQQRLLRMIWRRLHWGLNPFWIDGTIRK